MAHVFDIMVAKARCCVRSKCDLPFQPNPAPSRNGALGSLCQARCHSHAVPEPQCWAMQMAVKLPLIILAAALAITGCKEPAQQVKSERPAAAEIRQKLVGTWLVDLWATKRSADPLVVTFGPDGSFE